MTRIEFTAAVKHQAAIRARNRCQAPDCRQTPAHSAFDALCVSAGLRVVYRSGSFTEVQLRQLGRAIRAAAVTRPQACRELLTRYRFGEGRLAPLHYDHVREAADGGDATLENCQVLCIVCHLDKTAERARVRRTGPQVKTYGEERRAG